MNGYDIQLVAAITAAVFWNSITIFLQKKWRVYDIFIGKKHAQLVHGLLISFAWAQVVVISLFVAKSTWVFRPAVVLGLIIVAASVWMFFTAIKEIGKGSLVNSNFFGKNLHATGKLYAKTKHPMYLSYVTLFVGLGIIFGQYGYFLGAASLVIGLSVLAFIEKPHKHKHNSVIM